MNYPFSGEGPIKPVPLRLGIQLFNRWSPDIITVCVAVASNIT